MPRRRPKTRMELLADALVDAKDMHQALQKIDLRHTAGELREVIKSLRESAEHAADELERAILDLEEPPSLGSNAR